MILLLVLLVLASAQECPYCVYDACQITTQGLGNCSACNVGALVYVQAGNSFGPIFEETIGICQPCPSGCLTCAYGMISPAMSAGIVTINCTSCAQYYAYNYSNGNCAACSANCLSCECSGDTCPMTFCSTCASGYTMGNVVSGFACSPSTTAETL